MNYDYWRHYARGWLFHFFGKTEMAYAAYVEALRIDPADLRSLRHLASIAAEKQRWEVAESWYAKVLDLCPLEADTWFNLGFVRERAAKPVEAIAAFNEAVRLNSRHDRAWYGMGLAQARLGRHDAAAEAFREAVKLQPMNGEAFYQLGMALHHARRPDEVKAVVVRLLDFEPKRAKKLARDTGRADLMQLIPELPF